MRVRVWIQGAEGPFRDFELADAPRVGECISISAAGRLEEGLVTSVTWQLLGIQSSTHDLLLGVEPVGSVTLIHVICQPMNHVDAGDAPVGLSEEAGAT